MRPEAASVCSQKDKYGDSHVSIILNAGDKETLYAEMNKLLSKINN